MINLENWYKLDNVAKLFPAVTRKHNSYTFRVSMLLFKEINPSILQLALDNIITQFPMFAVRIRRGLFWYYLEANDERLLIHEEVDAPCEMIDRHNNNEYLIRVLYYNKKISVEFFHSISDGYGAVQFIKALSYEYIKLLENKNFPLIKHSEEKLESEDSFKEYFNPITINLPNEPKAYKIKGHKFNNFGNNVIKVLLKSDEVKSLCKKYDVTITEFFVGLKIYSLIKHNYKIDSDKLPINIVVPVNLRKTFKSKTLRNFFSIITISIKPEKGMSLNSILKEVKRQFKVKLDKSRLQSDITSHYRSEKSIFIRIAPLFIKNIILNIAYNLGTRLQTGSISNLGKIDLPDELKKYVDNMDLILQSSRINVFNIGICSVENTLSVTFTRTITEPNVIRDMITFLSQMEKIDVKLYSNQWGITNE